jgi:hypothetical protein
MRQFSVTGVLVSPGSPYRHTHRDLNALQGHRRTRSPSNCRNAKVDAAVSCSSLEMPGTLLLYKASDCQELLQYLLPRRLGGPIAPQTAVMRSWMQPCHVQASRCLGLLGPCYIFALILLSFLLVSRLCSFRLCSRVTFKPRDAWDPSSL